MEHVLFESQKKNVGKEKIYESSFIRELREECIDAIIQDSRCFNDLRKPGILKLFNKIVPGFKPPERHTVSKNLARKYIFFEWNTN